MTDKRELIVIGSGVKVGGLAIVAALEKEGHTVLVDGQARMVAIEPSVTEVRALKVLEDYVPVPCCDYDFEGEMLKHRKEHLKQAQPWKRKKKGKQ